MDNFVSINKDKQNTLTFEITVQGLSTEDVRVWFDISVTGFVVSLPCTRVDGGDSWEVVVPPLPFVDEVAYPFIVRMVVDGYFFEPMAGMANMVKNQNAVASKINNTSFDSQDSDVPKTPSFVGPPRPAFKFTKPESLVPELKKSEAKPKVTNVEPESKTDANSEVKDIEPEVNPEVKDDDQTRVDDQHTSSADDGSENKTVARIKPAAHIPPAAIPKLNMPVTTKLEPRVAKVDTETEDDGVPQQTSGIVLGDVEETESDKVKKSNNDKVDEVLSKMGIDVSKRKFHLKK